MEECFFQNKHFKDINPRGVGYEQCTPGHSCGPETRNHFLLHYILSGKGFLRIEHKTYQIEANNLFIIPPDTLFYFQADSENPWEYTWLCFDGEYVQKLRNLKSPIIPADPKYFENLLECRNYTGMEADYLASRLWLIFSQLFRQRKYDDYVTIARDYITTNYMRKIRIESIAQNIGVSRKYLSRLFKESTGQTMQDFLINLRLNKARGLIINHGYSVHAAARLVGYDDISAFSAIFKRHFGHSPGYYISKSTNDET